MTDFLAASRGRSRRLLGVSEDFRAASRGRSRRLNVGNGVISCSVLLILVTVSVVVVLEVYRLRGVLRRRRVLVPLSSAMDSCRCYQ